MPFRTERILRVLVRICFAWIACLGRMQVAYCQCTMLLLCCIRVLLLTPKEERDFVRDHLGPAFEVSVYRMQFARTK